jgi:D-cysteine desulfhydrase
MITPLNLAQKPTPITVLDGLVPGIKIHIKRDDMTGLLTSGNKIRKLEFLLADALAKGCNLVITCGPVQSNHVRSTIAACTQVGLKPVGVLRGEKKSIPDGNYLIDVLLGGDYQFITAEEYQNVDAIMESVALDYQGKGFRPYIIPEGGSNGIGALGYARVVEELTDYILKNKIDAIFAAVGSGGTYSGLLAGKYLQGLEIPIFGILVAHDIPTFQMRISKIIREMEQVLERKFFISLDEFMLHDEYIGPGYAQIYPEVIETIKKIAKYGILLDPVYTAKTFYGMLCELKQLTYKNPLFIHTGGIFSLFPYRDELFKE